MHIHVHAANARASCARPFGLFLHPLAAPQGAPFGGILPQKPDQEHKQEREQEQRCAFPAGYANAVHGWTASVQ